MIEHLTRKQIEDYRSRRLPAAELISVCDHIGVCEACRTRMESAVGSDAAFLALREGFVARTATPSHPELDRIVDHVDGLLAGEELEVITDHLSGCESCALAVQDLQEFRHEFMPKYEAGVWAAGLSIHTDNRPSAAALLVPLFRRGPVLAFGSALLTVLLTVAGWLAWRTAREKGIKPVVESAVPAPQPEARPASVLAQLNDGGHRVTLDRDGRVSGTENLAPEYRPMVAAALMGRLPPKPSVLSRLNRLDGRLMGGRGNTDPFAVTEPVGKVVMSDRPTFRWSAPGGAAPVYVVEIYDEEFRLAAASPQLTGNSWTASPPLGRGRVYSWQVKVVDKDGRHFNIPKPPARQARFCVLGQAAAEEIARARQTGSSHLVSALLYARAGLLDDAERELKTLNEQNPDSTIARRLLESVNAMRH